MWRFVFASSFSCKNEFDLQKHMDKHNYEPAYHCDHDNCDFATRSMQSFKSHYKRVHEVRRTKLHIQYSADLHPQETWIWLGMQWY